MGKLPLIMLPGWGMDSSAWEPLREDLAQEFELIMVEWDGIDDVSGFKSRVVQVIEQEISGSFSMLGWSLGSLVAVELAEKYQQIMKQLILISGTGRFILEKSSGYLTGWPQQVLEKMKSKLLRDKAETLDAFYDSMFCEAEKAQGAKEVFLCGMREVYSRLDVTNLSVGLDYLIKQDNRELLKKIKVPVLMIHGAEDKICPVSAGEYLSACLPGRKSLKVLANIGHMPFLTSPGECLRCIKDFIHESTD